MYAFTELPMEKGDSILKFLDHVLKQHDVHGCMLEIYQHRDKQGTLRQCSPFQGSIQDHFFDLCLGLNPQQEIGIVSRVDLIEGAFDENRRQLLLIDFQTAMLSDELKKRIGLALGHCQSRKMRMFTSGRSYHGYVDGLGSEKEWQRFMGQMLLMNKPGQPPTTDARWIGHKLKLGYGMLRLSANTSRHSVMPYYDCTISPIISADPNTDEDYA